MKIFNLKTLIKNTLPFLNVGNILRLVASLPVTGNRLFIIHKEGNYTFREVYKEAQTFARFFTTLREESKDNLKKKENLTIGVYMENSPEFIFAVFGAALTRTSIFGINTGFRGNTLAEVIKQSHISTILSDSKNIKEIENIKKDIPFINEDNIYLNGTPECRYKNLQERIAAAADKKKGPGPDNTTPLIVIYTSGTTGIPKAVPASHLKLFGAAVVTLSRLRLKKNDRGYISMPLFHSNAWYIGIMPVLMARASFVLKDKFSASAFEQDILAHGITYLNYVGQPVHYILKALENKYGSERAIIENLGNHSGNRFRIAHGNGATAMDRKKMMRYLNMYHIYELYGSTEAAVTSVVKPGDPIDCVGEVKSKKIVILDEKSNACEPGKTDKEGRLTNYEQAVGEICKYTEQNNLIFDGYLNNDKANNDKFREGIFHSGDLGHIRIVNGKRYLYFNGRTDDWIRKDGENFSAENVQAFAQSLPDVELAVAYGAPCPVADERVMIALQLKKGKTFNPAEAFAWFHSQQKSGGMDPKWMPDYIRIVDQFNVTETQKILVKPLKKESFNLEKKPDMKIYFRERGDESYRGFSIGCFNTMRDQFEENGRINLLS